MAATSQQERNAKAATPELADQASDRESRKPHRKRLVALAVILLVAAVALIAALSGGDDSTTAASASAGTTTARVERRDLITSDEYEGALGFGEAAPVAANRTGVVTALAAVGTEVGAGGTLFTINLQPTIVLSGSVPAFRQLDVDSDAGADIAQLEQGLVDLGFGSGVTVDNVFTSATAAAVETWEESLGRFDPDGTVELGDVVFAAGPVRVAEHVADVGTQVRPDSEVIKASPTAKVVTVSVSRAVADRLEAGTVVQLDLPGEAQSAGKVIDVGPEVAAPAPGMGGGGATVTVTIGVDDAAAASAFDSGAVTVTIERSRVEQVTAVPVTALLALAEGGYAIQAVDDSPAGYRLIGVEVGTYAENFVQITGEGVTGGLEVVVPR